MFCSVPVGAAVYIVTPPTVSRPAELCRVEEPAWLKRSSAPRGKVPTSGAGQITSSYGVGPTDDSGVPLFGLRALRKQKTDPAPPGQSAICRRTDYTLCCSSRSFC